VSQYSSRELQNYCRDNSPAMVERCRRHIDAYKAPTPVEVVEGDIRNITAETPRWWC
jgi:hypothetical protein